MLQCFLKFILHLTTKRFVANVVKKKVREQMTQNDAQEMKSHHMKVQGLFLPLSGKYSNKEYYERPPVSSLSFSPTLNLPTFQ